MLAYNKPSMSTGCSCDMMQTSTRHLSHSPFVRSLISNDFSNANHLIFKLYLHYFTLITKLRKPQNVGETICFCSKDIGHNRTQMWGKSCPAATIEPNHDRCIYWILRIDFKFFTWDPRHWGDGPSHWKPKWSHYEGTTEPGTANEFKLG